jgi:hypothetical protein
VAPDDIDLAEAEAVNRAFVSCAKALHEGNAARAGADTYALVRAIQNAPAGRELLELLNCLEVFSAGLRPDRTTLGCMIDQLTCARAALERQAETKKEETSRRLELEDEAEHLCALVESAIGVVNPDEALELHNLRMSVEDVRVLFRGEE